MFLDEFEHTFIYVALLASIVKYSCQFCSTEKTFPFVLNNRHKE